MTERTITDPGIYSMSDADYNGDPCVEHSLRSSIAWKLVAKDSTPAHARWADPRLNKRWTPTNKRHFDLGSACHAALFGLGKTIALIDGTNYSTNEGLKAQTKRELRDAAYEAGQIPLLKSEFEQVQRMGRAAKRQIDALMEAGAIDTNPFNPERSEQVLVWRDKATGVLCRAALDGLSIDGDVLSEYKTEGESAAPDRWQWKARRMGYLFRVAFYRRGLEALDIAYSPAVHFFVQETFPPYLLAHYTVDDELIARADAEVGRALKIWRRCLDIGKWPGYSTDGYEITLTEREQMEVAGQAHRPVAGAHVGSDDIAASLDKPTPLAGMRKR